MLNKSLFMFLSVEFIFIYFAFVNEIVINIFYMEFFFSLILDYFIEYTHSREGNF